MSEAPIKPGVLDDLDIETLRTRAERERRARREAEAISERATRALYERQSDLEVLEAVAAASNESDDIRDGIRVAVDAVCTRSQWPIGHAFLLDENGENMHPTGIWHLDEPQRFTDFRELTEASTFTLGVGMIGRVMASGKPIWVPDAKADNNFPRAHVAEGIGINAAFAFPILVGVDVVGVVECFSPTLTQPDERLLDLVGQVGVQLGRIHERELAAKEAKQSAAELRHYANELEGANDELKEFAYVASHDLAEPLRTITGFVQLLEKNYAGQLDETADEFIGFIVDGTERMQALIQGLLSYSRTGRSDLVTERVHLSGCAERAVAQVAASIEEADATLEIGELPVVMGDPQQLDRLFENLISNAIKFRGDGAPLVKVGSELREDHWHICVADNGIGIEERHRDRIFQVFQRLHGQAEYPGTGIGLAICKKVAERHGGTLTAEDTPGGGSTFRMVVPQSDVEATSR